MYFLIPLVIPSDLHGHLSGENLTAKFYILENFEISGPAAGQLNGRYSGHIPYIGHNFGYSMSCGLKVFR